MTAIETELARDNQSDRQTARHLSQRAAWRLALLTTTRQQAHLAEQIRRPR